MTGVAPAVDEAVFAQLVADLGPKHIGEVCRVFVDNATSGIDAVRRALDAHDPEAAAGAAHRLKSASGFVGATHLAGLCAAVEAGGDPGDALSVGLQRTTADLYLLVGRFARPAGTPAH